MVCGTAEYFARDGWGQRRKINIFIVVKKLTIYKYRENLWNAKGKNIRQHIYKSFKINIKSAFDDVILG